MFLFKLIFQLTNITIYAENIIVRFSNNINVTGINVTDLY